MCLLSYAEVKQTSLEGHWARPQFIAVSCMSSTAVLAGAMLKLEATVTTWIMEL